LVGAIAGIAINVWVAVGSVLYGSKAPMSPFIATEGCNVAAGATNLSTIEHFVSSNTTSNLTRTTYGLMTSLSTT